VRVPAENPPGEGKKKKVAPFATIEDEQCKFILKKHDQIVKKICDSGTRTSRA
jgi:hypothetical protein